MLLTKCKLLFEVTIEADPIDADELGSDLAVFLQESFFNGEDIIEVEYIKHKVLL